MFTPLQHENREYFGQFVTEDINGYIQRKRARDAHGNHIEIQAISEIYSRTVEVYCYQSSKCSTEIIDDSFKLYDVYIP